MYCVIPTEFWGSINSVQNGMLLTSSIHFLFDNHAVSVNPDVCMASIIFFLAFRSSALDLMVRALLAPISTKQLVDQLLQWHFRRVVLANIKGWGGSL